MSRTLLAVLSAAVLATGIGMVYVPAGVIAAGLQGLVAAYVWSYLSARARESSERGRDR